MPVFNKRQFLEQSLTSVLTAARRDDAVEIVCLDHGSTDGSREYLMETQGISVIAAEGGTISALRNEGGRVTTAPILVFLDSDVVVAPGFFSEVRRALQDPELTATGCECRVPDHPHWIERTWYQVTAREGDGPREYLNAATFVVRRIAFESVGGFSPTLVTGEDTDLSRRLLRAGFRLEQRDSLGTIHLDNPRSITAFYRKECWRGRSARQVSGGRRIDLTILAARLWGASIVLASLLGIVATVRRSLLTLVAAALLLLAVPGATIAWRGFRNRRIPPIVGGLLLTVVFLTARLSVLGQPRGVGAEPEGVHPWSATLLKPAE